MARFDKLELNQPTQPGPLQMRAEPEEANWLKRADQQRRAGEYEDALRFYSRALEEDKTLILGWVGQVQMLVQLGELKEADTWARKALELFPNNPELLAGRCRLNAGRPNRLRLWRQSTGRSSSRGSRRIVGSCAVR